MLFRSTNTGSSTAFDISDIEDTLPTGLGNAAIVSATYAGNPVSTTGILTQVGQVVFIQIRNASLDPDIGPGASFVVTYNVTVQCTAVSDSIAGLGHPGGVIDGPGCVSSVTNSADIDQFYTGNGATGAAISTITADTAVQQLDSDNDGIDNSIETITNSCPDSEGDGVPDRLDTDSDDNSGGESPEYNGGNDLDGSGCPY